MNSVFPRRCASCVHPPANTTTYTYDAFGHRLSATDPYGDTTRYGYYDNGLLCWLSPPTVTGAGSPCTNAYDVDGRLCWTLRGTASSTCPANGQTTDPPGPAGSTSYTYLAEWGERSGESGAGSVRIVSRLERITTDPEICHGQPTVRGLRYPVEQLLELLASGMTIEEIIEDHPDLERDDVLAALEFGALVMGQRRVVPLSPP